ncbi:hypothetical protein [Aquibacillus rhizosphaerae]|uniref:DUF4025 domain-containing protein n=1 Tax=Aquibacillus rhizosphaerae TaxID=3051431 RepID=A0ABT7L9D4_9BACI|nr:hypothetical protein [Aquibacillus sp. LR5S19]MDL4841180.1 hypothetical protein [Aquibacillus sp. LR5S19]
MKKERMSTFNAKTKENENEGISVETDLDPKHMFDTTDRYAGDSVNEHKQMEKANAYIAEEELEQINNNS